jgi:hypothetical protein
LKEPVKGKTMVATWSNSVMRPWRGISSDFFVFSSFLFFSRTGPPEFSPQNGPEMDQFSGRPPRRSTPLAMPSGRAHPNVHDKMRQKATKPAKNCHLIHQLLTSDN